MAQFDAHVEENWAGEKADQTIGFRFKQSPWDRTNGNEREKRWDVYNG